MESNSWALLLLGFAAGYLLALKNKTKNENPSDTQARRNIVSIFIPVTRMVNGTKNDSPSTPMVVQTDGNILKLKKNATYNINFTDNTADIDTSSGILVGEIQKQTTVLLINQPGATTGASVQYVRVPSGISVSTGSVSILSTVADGLYIIPMQFTDSTSAKTYAVKLVIQVIP